MYRATYWLTTLTANSSEEITLHFLLFHSSWLYLKIGKWRKQRFPERLWCLRRVVFITVADCVESLLFSDRPPTKNDSISQTFTVYCLYVQVTQPSRGRSNCDGSKGGSPWHNYWATKPARRGGRCGWMDQQNIGFTPADRLLATVYVKLRNQ